MCDNRRACISTFQFKFCFEIFIRSPPVATGGPVFPTAQHFGTMRGAPQQFQSQDAINRPAPTAPIGNGLYGKFIQIKKFHFD